MPYSSLYTQAKNSKKDFITNLAKPTMVTDPLTANITNKFGTSPASPSATSPVRANPAKQQFIQSQATQPAGFNQNAQMQTQGFDSAPQGTQTPPTPQTPAVDPNKGYKEAFQAYIQSLTPTPDETSATENLNRVSTQNRLDYEKALQSGETLGYATGLAGEQARTASIQEAGLSGRLSALTGQRQAMTEAQKARMEFEQNLLPKNESYTLGSGETRYDAQGNKIAEGAKKAPEAFELGEGQSRYEIDPKTGQYREVASKGKTYSPNTGGDSLTGTPNSYKEWQLAGGQAGTGKSYNDFLSDSNVKAPTQAQQTVGTYAVRIEQANPLIDSATETIAGMNPVVFEAQRKLPSYLQTKEYQQYDQAARNFINAVLRRESGAVISPSEFDNAYKQYLPRSGDSEQTLKQKKINRELVYSSFKKSAGTAYSSVNELLGTQGSSAPNIEALRTQYGY